MQSSAPGRSPRPARARRAPAAFTLLELLIAIAIIGILASLILTVAGSANIKAKNAQVTVDIKDLEKGIAAFKQKFNVEPPSRIKLYEQGTVTAPSGANSWNSDPRSMGLIRQIWPQFDFTIDRDINGDGNMTETITLSGAECLVFFLGGVPALIVTHSPAQPGDTPANQGGPPMGFSQNPADPFNRSGSNRDRFTEFDASRLLWYQSAQPNRMNTYLDTLPGQQQPYLYLSSYNGQGYDVANELPAGPPGNQTFADVYRQGPNGSTSTSPPPSPPWNPNSYQIISPGADQLYGKGGQYDSNTAGTMLVNPPLPAPPTRGPERDNITNFSSGVLAP
jgi:prepilin-type N-terminal cleavage/methylation domain-containing protein